MRGCQNLLVLAHCLSSFHPGTGVSVSYVDLPIQREASTGWPMMQGSGFKGALRHVALGQWKKEEVWAVFGPDPQAASESAGAVRFTDLRVALFPVKSLRKIFAWTTSPGLMARMVRELRAFGFKWIPPLPPEPTDGEALLSPKNQISEGQVLVLEEFAFRVQEEKSVNEIGRWFAKLLFPHETYFREHLSRNLVVVSDTVLSTLLELSMEVVTRIRINPETGTVAEGALWNEEHLPAETVLYGFVLAEEARGKQALRVEEVVEKIKGLAGVVQMGGDATIGKGLLNLVFMEQS